MNSIYSQSTGTSASAYYLTTRSVYRGNKRLTYTSELHSRLELKTHPKMETRETPPENVTNFNSKLSDTVGKDDGEEWNLAWY